jgi:uncharacterized membrane protein YfcA
MAWHRAEWISWIRRTGLIPVHQAAFLFSVALVAGAINSVAGGGGFLCFPALIFTGVPPVNANATNTMALWPGTVASTGAYREEMRGTRKHLIPLLVSGAVGSLAGAKILLMTPQAMFMKMVPWLLLSATLLFLFSKQLAQGFHKLSRTTKTGHNRRAVVLATVLQLLIAVYIGFFGAGAGIMMLALFAVLGIENIHTMNGMKTLMASVCNGIALITFISARAIWWPQAIVMTIGAGIGGYFGAYFAQRTDPRIVRSLIIVTGFCLTGYFFWRTL